MFKANKEIIAFLLAALLVMAPLIGASAAGQERLTGVTIFVAPDGNDTTGNGTFDSPYKTLEAARDKIRTLKATGDYTGGITVYLRGGDYTFTSKFSLGAKDSGTPEAPIVYTNYPGERVTFVGGKSFGKSDFVSASDDPLLNRLINQDIKSKILKIDLKNHGITNMGEPYRKGSYTYNKSGAGYVGSELFADGAALTPARYPNSGRIVSDKVYYAGYDSNGEGSKTEDGENVERSVPFEISVKEDGHIEKWSASLMAAQNGSKNKVLMYGWWKYDWCDETIPISSIEYHEVDSDGSKLYKLTSEHSAYLCPDEDYGDREFYVYNLIEELDIPGEYYLDYDNSAIYLYPPEDFESARIDISLIDTELIYMSNAENIVFSGIDITVGRKYGYYIDNCKNIEIRDCEITNTGSKAVSITNSYGCGVRDSYIHDVNGGVVISGGDRDTLTPGNNYVTGCHIENFSRIDTNYNGAVNVAGVGNTVTHNKIHTAPHLAISFGGQNNNIMYNEIYDVCRERCDSGAIYGGLTWLGRGTRIENNYLHDIRTVSTGPLGISGIYLDGAQGDMSVSNNVFYNVDGGCIWVGGGQDVVVTNNYFIDSRYGLWLQSPMTVDKVKEYDAKFYDSGLASNEIWQQTFPKLFTFMAQSPEERTHPTNNTYKNNISFNSKLCQDGKSDHAREYIADIDTNNCEFSEDPGFEDYANGDFTLSGDEIALTGLQGFKPIDVKNIGIADSSDLDMQLLSELTLSDGTDIGFVPDRLDYTITVPYNAQQIEIPNVTAVSQNSAVQVKVSYPTQTELSDGVGYIAIDVICDESVTTYRIYVNVLGRNLYSNGGAERAPWYSGSGYWWTVERIDSNPGAGAYSSLHNGGSYYLPGEAKPVMLTKDKTYLASSMVRKSQDYDDDLNVVSEVKVPASSGTVANFPGTVTHYMADGSIASSNKYALDADTWLTHYRTIVPTDNSYVTDIYTVRNHSTAKDYRAFYFVTDEYYLGELVISKLEFADTDGNPVDTVISSQLAETTLNLCAKAVNQLGNNAGLLNEKVSSWRLIQAPTGVSINEETGVVTINPGAAGKVVAEAAVVPSYKGALQTVFTDRLEFDIVSDGFSYTKDQNGDITLSLRYKNHSAGDENLTAYVVIYHNTLNTPSVHKVELNNSSTLEAGKVLSFEKKLTLPADSDYSVGSFLWKENLIPATKSQRYP